MPPRIMEMGQQQHHHLLQPQLGERSLFLSGPDGAKPVVGTFANPEPDLLPSAQSSNASKVAAASSPHPPTSSATPTPVSSQDHSEPQSSSPLAPAANANANANANGDPQMGPRSGRWLPEEKILFLHGLRTCGKGRWKKMSVFLPHRSLVQIKSHAQKVLKRMEAGENVFRRLDECRGILDSLLNKAAREREEILRAGLPVNRKQTHRKMPPKAVSPAHSNPNSDSESGPGAVIAAAALCQLSSVGAWDKNRR